MHALFPIEVEQICAVAAQHLAHSLRENTAIMVE